MTAENGRIALVAGASGLVGSALVRRLLDSPRYARVIALSRRPLAFDHPRFANRILRFEEMEKQLATTQCHEAYCCLGTTLKQAGSEAAFRAVDQKLVVRFARVAKAQGAELLVHTSSVRADPGSKNFYLRVKGETEKELETIMLPALHIMQPAVLLGTRRETRPLELAAQWLMPVVNPLLMGEAMRYRGVRATALAGAMLSAAGSQRRGVYRYSGLKLQELLA
jgi:uncharacterized protein YbjT (DUF2867 family)